jgi:hypothetical protein
MKSQISDGISDLDLLESIVTRAGRDPSPLLCSASLVDA